MQRRKSKSPQIQKGAHIDPKEKIKLWVRAGGRCEFPGHHDKYLLEDEFTNRHVSLEEIAHIVGKSKDGPRGNNPLPSQDRNKADNFLLLCAEHHRKIIDRKELSREFSVTRLRKYKKEHEERIRYLTSLGPEAETLVICMTGDIRGNTTSINREEMRKAVLESAGRYPKYLGGDNYYITIDLEGIPITTHAEYMRLGKGKIDDIINSQINRIIKDLKIKHLSVFALARIPFLIYLGWKLGDKIPTDIYQKHRSGNEDWIWRNRGRAVDFKYAKIKSSRNKKNVALILSVSGKIKISSLPQNVKDEYSIYEILPEAVMPSRNILRLKSSLDNFKKTYEKVLREIENNHKNAKHILLFPAIPNSVAVACGRGELLRDVSPSLLVYDKTENGYNFSLEVK
jgi:hypothetical protein